MDRWYLKKNKLYSTDQDVNTRTNVGCESEKLHTHKLTTTNRHNRVIFNVKGEFHLVKKNELWAIPRDVHQNDRWIIHQSINIKMHTFSLCIIILFCKYFTNSSSIPLHQIFE